MKKRFTMLLTLVFIIMLSTPALAATGDIVDIASGDENFSILVTALQEAELVGALQGEGPFTVFAPTNDAFAALLEALDITAADLLAQPDLADVLLYHVVSGKIMSTDLTDDMMATTLQGESLTINLDDGVMVNSSKVTTADIEATNGVIHVIDAVLVPESFVLEDIMDMPEVTDMPNTGGESLYTPMIWIGILLAITLLIRKRLLA
ncbi:fasciclin domain-containing protein [Clostridia bacterium]|nr:fasciclin domain-containing protein [Clostridia bacterium]